MISAQIGERLCKTIAANQAYSSDRSSLPRVTISIGVTEMKMTDTPETFVGTAEKNLEEGKNRGEK